MAQVRDLLGGEVRYMSSGAAPLSPQVLELLKVCFSCDVLQGVRLLFRRTQHKLTTVSDGYDRGKSCLRDCKAVLTFARLLAQLRKGEVHCVLSDLRADKVLKSIAWDTKHPGNCGQVQPCNEIKLVDVSDMGVCC